MGLAFILLLLFGIGFVCGLRSMTAPAVVCWGAHLGWLQLAGSPSGFFAHSASLIIFTIFAFGELVADKLPKTPSRTAPPSFAARIVLGAFAGAVIGTAWGYTWSALGAGAIGAVLGTLGGYQARTRLVAAHGHDLPIALLEDAVAVLGAFALAAVTAAL